MVPPFDTTISRDEARRVYNTLGTELERSARYEERARRYALDALDLQPDQQVLQIGVGTALPGQPQTGPGSPCGSTRPACGDGVPTPDTTIRRRACMGDAPTNKSGGRRVIGLIRLPCRRARYTVVQGTADPRGAL